MHVMQVSVCGWNSSALFQRMAAQDGLGLCYLHVLGDRYVF